MYPSVHKKRTHSAWVVFYMDKETVLQNQKDRDVKTVPGTTTIHCNGPSGVPGQVRLRAYPNTVSTAWEVKLSTTKIEHAGPMRVVSLRFKDASDDVCLIHLMCDDDFEVAEQNDANRCLCLYIS